MTSPFQDRAGGEVRDAVRAILDDLDRQIDDRQRLRAGLCEFYGIDDAAADVPTVDAPAPVIEPAPQREPDPPRLSVVTTTSHLNLTKSLADAEESPPAPKPKATATREDDLHRYSSTQRLMLRDEDGTYLHMTCAAMTAERKLAWQGTKVQLAAVLRKYPATKYLTVEPVIQQEPVKANAF